MLKVVLLLVGLASARLVAPGALQANRTTTAEDYWQQWTQFQKDHGKTYETKVHHDERFNIFMDNIDKINTHNAKKLSWTLGVNQFADLTAEEFKAQTACMMPSRPRMENPKVLDESATPDSIDWEAEGKITPVKNQGQCGSCWAFSTTEGVESAIFMQTGQMPVLSTQQIISCDQTDYGCNGGDPASALQYIEQAGGLDVASDYTDTSHATGSTGKCKWDKQVAAKVTGWRYAIPLCDSGDCSNQNEHKLAAALAKNGPLSICVNAQYWDSYESGVFNCGKHNQKCSGAAYDLDHCVQLVGYDMSGSSPYWKVRNSWGTSWGEDGFIRLPFGKNACGVADEAYIINATLVDALGDAVHV